jgi:outer membrane protein assembly factor BamA
MLALRLSVGALMLATLAIFAPAADAEDEPPPIGNIEIVTNQVFYEAEYEDLFWPYEVANKLHVKTREDIIRQELLFAPGDPADPEILAETERNLRSLIFIRDARIETIPAEDGTVDVRVRTFDAWSTVPELSFAKVGNEFTWAVGASERNLFGRGKHFEFIFRHGLERDSTNFFYRDPRVAGSRVASSIGYSDLSDGSRGHFAVSRPFFSIDTKWAFGLQLQGFDQLDALYQDGERVEDLHHVSSGGSIDVARAVSRTGYSALRLHAGYQKQRDDVDGMIRDFGILRVGVSSLRHRYLKLTHVNRFEVAEDFNLGNQASAFYGISTPALGGEPGTVHFFFLSEQAGVPFGAEHFLRGSAVWEARHRRQRLENSLAFFRLEYVNKMTPRRALLATAQFRYGSNLDPEVQLTLGAQNGLRGYPVFQFVGDRSLLLSAEQRIFIADEVARLVSFAVGFFADAGYAWPAGTKMAFNDLRADIGVGLLLGRNRLSSTNPGVRFDLAYALHPVAGKSRWLFSVGSRIGL